MDTNTLHTCKIVAFKTTFMMKHHFLFSKYSLNLFINVRRIALYTLHQDIFIHYIEGFNFVTGKASQELKDVHLTIPNKAPCITPYNKVCIRNCYVILQKIPVYRKSEKYELFRKQNWFGAVHPRVQIQSKLDYMISRI